MRPIRLTISGVRAGKVFYPPMGRRTLTVLPSVPRLCGTCRHWDGAVNELGYGACALPEGPVRVPHFAGTKPGVGCTARQGERCPAWQEEPHLSTTARRCLNLLPDTERWGALLALAARRTTAAKTHYEPRR